MPIIIATGEDTFKFLDDGRPTQGAENYTYYKDAASAPEEVRAQLEAPRQQQPQRSQEQPVVRATGDTGQRVANTAVPTEQFSYTVKKGDTLWDLGQKYGVAWQDIAAANGITEPRLLQIGTKLTIPGAGAQRPVAPGTGTNVPLVRATGVTRTSAVQGARNAGAPANLIGPMSGATGISRTGTTGQPAAPASSQPGQALPSYNPVTGVISQTTAAQRRGVGGPTSPYNRTLGQDIAGATRATATAPVMPAIPGVTQGANTLAGTLGRGIVAATPGGIPAMVVAGARESLRGPVQDLIGPPIQQFIENPPRRYVAEAIEAADAAANAANKAIQSAGVVAGSQPGGGTLGLFGMGVPTTPQGKAATPGRSLPSGARGAMENEYYPYSPNYLRRGEIGLQGPQQAPLPMGNVGTMRWESQVPVGQRPEFETVSGYPTTRDAVMDQILGGQYEMRRPVSYGGVPEDEAMYGSGALSAMSRNQLGAIRGLERAGEQGNIINITIPPATGTQVPRAAQVIPAYVPPVNSYSNPDYPYSSMWRRQY